jgi:glycerophosphoryl diester phosphodiesterase
MNPHLETDFFAPPRPRLFAHRGASGDYPENSMPAFEAAVRIGVPYIELDVHLTKDGAVVVSHDDNLVRVAGRNGLIDTMTLADVRTYDIGFSFSRDGEAFPFRGSGIHIPTLQEVLETFSEQLFVIEIKQQTPTLVGSLFATIRETGMDRRVLVASEHQQPLDEIRALAPGIPTNCSSLEVAEFIQSMFTGTAWKAAPGAALQIPPEHGAIKLVTAASVAAAHQLGLEVHVWTVNEENQMRELLAMGVDGIISDYPARLREVVASR